MVEVVVGVATQADDTGRRHRQAVSAFGIVKNKVYSCIRKSLLCV